MSTLFAVDYVGIDKEGPRKNGAKDGTARAGSGSTTSTLAAGASASRVCPRNQPEDST